MTITVFQKARDGLMLYVRALCETAPENVQYLKVSLFKGYIYFERADTREGSSP